MLKCNFIYMYRLEVIRRDFYYNEKVPEKKKKEKKLVSQTYITPGH